MGCCVMLPSLRRCCAVGPGSGCWAAWGCTGPWPSSVPLSSQDEVATAETTRNEATSSLLPAARSLPPAVAPLRGEGAGASTCCCCCCSSCTVGISAARLFPAVALCGEDAGAICCCCCCCSHGAVDPPVARSGSATPVNVDGCDVDGGTASWPCCCCCPCSCPSSRCCCGCCGCFWACRHAGLNTERVSTAAADLAPLVGRLLPCLEVAGAGAAAAGVAPGGQMLDCLGNKAPSSGAGEGGGEACGRGGASGPGPSLAGGAAESVFLGRPRPRTAGAAAASTAIVGSGCRCCGCCGCFLGRPRPRVTAADAAAAKGSTVAQATTPAGATASTLPAAGGIGREGFSPFLSASMLAPASARGSSGAAGSGSGAAASGSREAASGSGAAGTLPSPLLAFEAEVWVACPPLTSGGTAPVALLVGRRGNGGVKLAASSVLDF